MKKSAFTLVELLIVIAIIALLMAILMPALNMAKDNARRIHCISNIKNLTLAWLLYKDDNDDKLVNAHVPEKKNFQKGVYWVEPPQDPSGNYAGRPATREEEIRGIERGLLFMYTKTVDLYRCPSDERKRDPSQDTWRSFSMAGGMNGEARDSVPAENYLQIKSPSTKYVFLEESDGRGWNVGSWVLNPKTETWVDPLSIWHSKSKSTLGWADGSAEMHTWVDKSTIEMSEKHEFRKVVPPGEGEDLQFMLKGYTYSSLK